MHPKWFKYGLIMFLTAHNISGQSPLSFDVDPPGKIQDRFELEVQDHNLDKILDITGQKISVNPQILSFNQIPLQVKSCKTRGNTTLLYRRKSFSISLNEPIYIQQRPVQKLAINNMAMDQNYWRARLCFLLMERLGIFHLSNQYVELTLNRQTQGAYLAIQKPDDYVQSLQSNLMVRRGANKISIEYSEGPINRILVKKLRTVRDLPKNLSGKQLFDSLNTIINMKHYNKWLAFNFLILNGDYQDELFLYLGPETNRFEIIPWDYDDIFASQPHEGIKRRNQALGNRLLFSSESALDLAIGNDDYLYSIYLNDFGGVVAILTPERLKESFEQVYRELLPFFMTPEIIAQSQYDQNGLTNLNALQQDLIHHFEYLLRRLSTIEDTIGLQQGTLSE